jgi:hypothetical protein
MKGSCHCGKVAYRIDAEPREAMACNCSICHRKGYLLFFTTPDTFVLETPRSEISVYTFKSHNIRHQFCKTCGCAPFSEGTGQDRKPMLAINLRCAEGIDLAAVKITEFDGASLA